MTLGWRSLLAGTLLIVLGAVWLLHDDPEARVRAAHETLRELITKEQGESPAGMLAGMRSLRRLFAEEIVVAGDAGTLAARYTDQELAATVQRIRELFASVELGIDDLEVEFPRPGEAVGRFSATLSARPAGGSSAGGERLEVRRVTSRLIESDGRWRFTAFELEDVRPGD